MAEANGNRTHPGPSRPRAGFEDQEHHQAPVTSTLVSVLLYNNHITSCIKGQLSDYNLIFGKMMSNISGFY